MSGPPVEEFWSRVAEVDHVNATGGSLEPALLAVLEHVKAHPEMRAAFVECFARIVRREVRASKEVVIFCMRELRWPEIAEEARRRLANATDPRVSSVMFRYLAVYEQEWEGADLYLYYSTPRLPDLSG